MGQQWPALKEMEMAGVAHSKVVSIDTLKKFVNLMSKDDLPQVFNPAMHRFRSAGETVIAMGHTNKGLVGGKKVHLGVTDCTPSALVGHNSPIALRDTFS